MKGIHKTNKPNIGNVEMQRAAFQQAKSKNASLAKTAEESLKFNKLVEDSKKKVVPKKEDGSKGGRGGGFWELEKPQGNQPLDEDEEDPSYPSSPRLDIRI